MPSLDKIVSDAIDLLRREIDETYGFDSQADVAGNVNLNVSLVW